MHHWSWTHEILHDDRSIPTNSVCSLFVAVGNMVMIHSFLIMLNKFNAVRISTNGCYEHTWVTK
jgi:hypothetical protein